MLTKVCVRTSLAEEAKDITDEVQRAVAEAGVREGFVVIYIPHDAAAVSIHRTLAQADAPKLDRILDAVNPDRETPEYTKAAFVAPTEVGVGENGRMVLGDDQRVYFYESDGPRERSVYVYVGRVIRRPAAGERTGACSGRANGHRSLLSLFSSEDEHEGLSRQGTVAHGAKDLPAAGRRRER